jgi:hypothetical protein
MDRAGTVAASRFGIESFTLAFIVQKVGEFVLLSVCLAAQFFIGSRFAEHADRADWGVVALHQQSMSVQEAIGGGLAVTAAFFLFTLYPVVTYVVVALCRALLRSTMRPGLPWISALVSVQYVLLWVVMTGFDFRLVPYWIVTAITAAFILASSYLLYPPKRVATPSMG